MTLETPLDGYKMAIFDITIALHRAIREHPQTPLSEVLTKVDHDVRQSLLERLTAGQFIVTSPHPPEVTI